MGLFAVLTSVLSLMGQAVEVCNRVWGATNLSFNGGAMQYDQQPNRTSNLPVSNTNPFCWVQPQ